MTVRELKEKIADLPDDMYVAVCMRHATDWYMLSLQNAMVTKGWYEPARYLGLYAHPQNNELKLEEYPT